MQKVLFYILLILLPVQLGRHFWPEFAFVSGIRVDYFSPTLYLTDILVFLIFLWELPQLIRLLTKKNLFAFLVIGLLATANIYFSLSPALSIYKWLKVFEIGFLAYFVAINFKASMTLLLLIPVLYESLLIYLQFLTQGAVGGLWWFLGERSFYSGTPGIANTIIYSQLVLRPYGTFAHPNVAAGFLAVILPLVIYYFPHKYRKLTAGIVALGFSALILTMSRSAVVVGSVATATSLALKVKKAGLIVVIFLTIILGMTMFLGLREEVEPVVARREMILGAVNKWKESPIFGTGLGTSPMYGYKGNFALRQQPVHNIYVLALSEVGLIGFIGMGLVLFIAFRKVVAGKKWMIGASLLSVCFLGLVDHYFLTLQQGQLVLALVIGLCFAKINK